MNPPKSNLILMADDDADDRLLVQDALRECGVNGCEPNIHFVTDGEELMDYLLHRNQYAASDSAPTPGLILLDLNMPRKDGREALREIRACAELRRLPVVMFTTSKADTDVASIYALGANSFVTKPQAFDALIKILGVLTQYWFGVVELPEPKARPA
jgi:CheY-like chemotaxis protein